MKIKTKTRNSVSDRIKITRRGKIQRRSMALGHNRSASKRSVVLNRKKARGLKMPLKTVKKYI